MILGEIVMTRIFAAAGAALLLAACTTTTITPATSQRPAQNYTAVALGDVQIPDKQWEPELLHFRSGFIARLKETKSFTDVDEATGSSAAPGTVIVTGTITDIDKGNKALRILIGLGAGRERVEGNFQIVGADGVTYAKFNSAKAYSGGAGIGGVDFVDIDDLIEKYGAEIADVVARWAKGEPLDDTNAQ
jgi:hypothetical protein